MFKNSERRNDLDKAYHSLIRVVCANVERMAEEHQKTPRAVVMMGKPKGGKCGNGRVGTESEGRGGEAKVRWYMSVLACDNGRSDIYARVIGSGTGEKRRELLPCCALFQNFVGIHL